MVPNISVMNALIACYAQRQLYLYWSCGSHSGDCEQYCLLRRFGVTYSFHLQCRRAEPLLGSC
jgi:hypothetical protein